MRTQYLHHIHSPTTLPHISPLLLPGRTCAALLFSDFVLKKCHFLFV
jgi:hypothetical protein